MKIGIDLGTANILVAVKGRGVILSEPSVVAIREDDNRVVAVGEEAREMIGRTPANLRAVRPMRDGVIADYVITEAMLRHAINRVARIRLFRPEVMISVPSGVTSVERRAVRDAALKAGARAAFLIEEPLAAAIGANVEIGAASGSMIVDIGGGTTEIAVLSLGSIVVSDSLRVGGNKLDEAIAAYMRRTHNLMIGDRTAEAVKIDVGSAMPVDEPLRTEVKGRDTLGGLPRTVVVTSNEITRAMDAPLQAIVDAIRGVLERTPPELASDIIDKGMVLSGGTALLRNLDRLLTQVTGVPCVLADDPLHSVAIGTGIALENLNAYRKSLVTA
jgi:rod shape-determining protein MreB and related proteins